MMQSGASAAKLRRAGPFYKNGTAAMGGHGTLPPRILIGSLSPKPEVRRTGVIVWVFGPLVITGSWSGEPGTAEQAHALRQLAGGGQLPQRNQELAGERYDHDLLGWATAVLSARPVPLHQPTVWLVFEEP